MAESLQRPRPVIIYLGYSHVISPKSSLCSYPTISIGGIHQGPHTWLSRCNAHTSSGKAGSGCGKGGGLGSLSLRDSPYLAAKAFSRVQAVCNHTTRTHNFTPLTDSSRRTHSARAFTDCRAEPRRYGRLWGSGFSLPPDRTRSLCKPAQIQPLTSSVLLMDSELRQEG